MIIRNEKENKKQKNYLSTRLIPAIMLLTVLISFCKSILDKICKQTFKKKPKNKTNKKLRERFFLSFDQFLRLALFLQLWSMVYELSYE